MAALEQRIYLILAAVNSMLEFDDVEILIRSQRAFASMVKLFTTACDFLHQNLLFFFTFAEASNDLLDSRSAKHGAARRHFVLLSKVYLGDAWR